MNYFMTMAAGLAAGAGHVFAAPDHLAAVAPLAVDRPVGRWRVGFCWGLGHSGGVWLLAFLALVFREALPIEQLSLWGERIVGFVLIAIGLMGLRRLVKSRVHTHVHEHDGVRHAHIHLHDKSTRENHLAEHTHSHRAVCIGTLHGLAGTAHLLGILPALLLPTGLGAVLYVAMFGIGSIVGMSVFAWALGRAVDGCGHLGDRAYVLLLGSCCTAALLVGIYWCYTTILAPGTGL